MKKLLLTLFVAALSINIVFGQTIDCSTLPELIVSDDALYTNGTLYQATYTGGVYAKWYKFVAVSNYTKIDFIKFDESINVNENYIYNNCTFNNLGYNGNLVVGNTYYIPIYTNKYPSSNFQFQIALRPFTSNTSCTNTFEVVPTLTDTASIQNLKFKNSGSSLYYKFVAQSKSVKIINETFTDTLKFVEVYKNCSSNYFSFLRNYNYYSNFQFNKLRVGVSGLEIGKEYIYRIISSNCNNTNCNNLNNNYLKNSIINIKKEDDLSANPSELTKNVMLSLNLTDYTYGRDIVGYQTNKCWTSKQDINTSDVFFSFTASSAYDTIEVNVDDVNLETVVEVLSSKNTNYKNICIGDIQVGKSKRIYPFSGLTEGITYTIRVEFGGNTSLGYARMSGADNASVMLRGSTITAIESADVDTTKTISAIYNLQGIEVNNNYHGLVIYRYSDGSTRKIVQ